MFRVFESPGYGSKGEASQSREAITYDYYPITCGDAGMEMDVCGNSFVRANYVGRVNRPNVIYTDAAGTRTNYQTQRISVFGVLHDIGDIAHEGEIVVEHRPTVSNNTRLVSCFLVRSDALDYPGNRNRVSDLLEAPGLLGGVQAVELALNEFLTMAPSGDGVMQYETRDADGVLCRVLVFTRPIRARGDFSALSRRAPFAARPLAAPRAAIAHCVVTRAGSEPALYTQNAREGFSTMTISGEQVLTSDGSDNDIFTCEYLPVTGDTAKVFQIPIDTKMVNESANNQLSSMTTYVILSVMFTVAIYFCAPALYDAGWLRAYKTRLEAPFVFLLAIKSDLTYLDMFATIVTLILSMTLIGVGVQKSKTSLSLMGIFFLLMFVVGAGSIQISRLLRGNSVGVVESVKPT